jgi:hypothetical protein
VAVGVGDGVAPAFGSTPTAIVTVPPVERAVPGAGDWPITLPTFAGSGRSVVLTL